MLCIQSDRETSTKEKMSNQFFLFAAVLVQERRLHMYKEVKKIERHKQYRQDGGFLKDCTTSLLVEVSAVLQTS